MSISIFNDVLGPIMRGPSSGHTAATWRMGYLSRQLFGNIPKRLECRFHKFGAYANVFRQQRSDLAFAAGLMELSMTEKSYDLAFEEVEKNKIDLNFTKPELLGANHPNEVEVFMEDEVKSLTLRLRSIGGGVVNLISINGNDTNFTGDKFAIFLLITPQDPKNFAHELNTIIEQEELKGQVLVSQSQNNNLFYSIISGKTFHKSFIETLKNNEQTLCLYQLDPIMFPVMDKQELRQSLAENIFSKDLPKIKASKFAKNYEMELLGISEEEAEKYLNTCSEVMQNAVKNGLELQGQSSMKILKPLASTLFQNKENMLIGGIHSEVALYSMAAAEWNGSGGLILAAPTAGSGAIIPAVLVKLKELSISDKSILKGLWAAGLIGLAIADQYTFAGGVGGCQVEIGSAGAMAAALIVEASLDHKAKSGEIKNEFLENNLETVLAAATLFLQNSLGLVCDPVQGFVELPCISRNATAASQSFVCADLALAGWKSPLSFYDTVLAMKDVGERMAPELRCTSLGGLASRSLKKLS